MVKGEPSPQGPRSHMMKGHIVLKARNLKMANEGQAPKA